MSAAGQRERASKKKKLQVGMFQDLASKQASKQIIRHFSLASRNKNRKARSSAWMWSRLVVYMGGLMSR